MILKSPYRTLESQQTVIMGVMNLTLDSFYSGSRIFSVQEAVDKAGIMIDEGAEIIELGAMSTRPGSKEISPEAEMTRILPTLSAIRRVFTEIFISVDTYRAAIAIEAVKSGADIINDISGGKFDEKMFDVIAELNVPYVLMHTGGKPEIMQDNPVYSNVVEEITSFFSENIKKLQKKNIQQIILDPGFGFGKTIEHNYRLLAVLSDFCDLGFPLMVGISRKSMIHKVLDITPETALNGTTVLNTIALLNGTDILRVHDIKEAVQCRQLVNTYLNSNTRLTETDPSLKNSNA